MYIPYNTLKKNNRHSPISICRYIQKLSLESAKFSNIHSLWAEKKNFLDIFYLQKAKRKRENIKSPSGSTNQVDVEIATRWRLKWSQIFFFYRLFRFSLIFFLHLQFFIPSRFFNILERFRCTCVYTFYNACIFKKNKNNRFSMWSVALS